MAAELLALRYTLEELCIGGYPFAELKALGCEAGALTAAGFVPSADDSALLSEEDRKEVAEELAHRDWDLGSHGCERQLQQQRWLRQYTRASEAAEREQVVSEQVVSEQRSSRMSRESCGAVTREGKEREGECAPAGRGMRAVRRRGRQAAREGRGSRLAR